MPAKWIAWNQVANLIPADDAGRMMALVERLIATAVDAVSVQDFFRQQLPEMAAVTITDRVGRKIRGQKPLNDIFRKSQMRSRIRRPAKSLLRIYP